MHWKLQLNLMVNEVYMERVIIDCDPGHDDAVALALLKTFEEKIKLEAIIATYGNQTLDKTLTNALNLVQALNLKCPVYEGSSEPLVRDRLAAGYIHGENGLEGPVFPPCHIKSSGNGIKAALDLVINNPGEITFISVGPFTDLAICLKADPRFAKSLKKIVLMGGSLFKAGNVTTSAEFNVYADPEAASIVFNSGVEIIDFPLDATLQVTLTEELLDRIRKGKESEYKKIFFSSMYFYTQSCLKYIHDYPSMHDPCTVMYLAHPELFEFRRGNVVVETGGKNTYGKTVAGWEDNNSKTACAVKVNTQKFWEIFFDCLERLP